MKKSLILLAIPTLLMVSCSTKEIPQGFYKDPLYAYNEVTLDKAIINEIKDVYLTKTTFLNNKNGFEDALIVAQPSFYSEMKGCLKESNFYVSKSYGPKSGSLDEYISLKYSLFDKGEFKVSAPSTFYKNSKPSNVVVHENGKLFYKNLYLLRLTGEKLTSTVNDKNLEKLDFYVDLKSKENKENFIKLVQNVLDF